MKRIYLKQFKHIGIVQTAFLGDVALTLPLAEAVKLINPDAKVTFMTTPQAAQIVQMSDSVDDVIVYDKRRTQSGFGGISFMASQLHDRGVDCVLTPHRSLRSTIISKMTRVFSVGFNKNSFSFLYSKRVEYPFHKHEIQRNISLLSPFDDFDSELCELARPRLTVSESDINRVNLLMKESRISSDDRIVALAPASVWATKQWTEKGFTELAEKLVRSAYTVILLGTESDKELCERISRNSACLSFAGLTTIPQTIEIMRRAVFAVSNDSAPTHFAGLAECPNITIFGATSPIFGFGPCGKYDKVVRNSTLKCSPCAIHGHHKCPKRNFECMESISADLLYDECMNIVNEIHGVYASQGGGPE